MTQLPILRDIILILAAALSGGIVAKKLRFPLIVGYLFAGMIVGALLVRSIEPALTIKSVAQVGAALLLFTLGLENSLNRLKEFGEVVILASFVQVTLCILLGVIVFPLFGLDFYSSLFLGTVFSLSSTAIVVKTLSDKGELDSLHGQIATGWLLMQDLYTLPIIIILPSVGFVMKDGQDTILSLLLLGKSILIALTAFFLVLTIGKKVVPFILEKVADFASRELLLISSVIICLLFAYLFQLAGFSSALGAFIAGILLSSSSIHHSIFAEIRPLRDLFTTIFFVSLGFILDPNFLISSWTLILVLVIIVILSKFIISFILMILLGYHTKTATLVGSSLISVGEFAIILALLGLSTGLITQQLYMTILSVSFITLVISVPVLNVCERLYYQVKFFIIKKIPKGKEFINRLDAVSTKDQLDMTDHIVILGHGRVGKYISKALESAAIPYLIIDYNYHLVRILERQGLKVIYGDPVEIDVLRLAQLDRAKAVILAYADRATQETVITNALNLNPKIRLFCRTHFEEDLRRLKSLGVEVIVQPEFEAAITLIEKILWIFHTSPMEISEKLQKIRREHG